VSVAAQRIPDTDPGLQRGEPRGRARNEKALVSVQ
jgi:hypothetical protein